MAGRLEELETENWPGILSFFRLPIPASGHVVDAATGAPIAGAELRAVELGWNYDEHVTTSAAGRFHLWLPTGAWRVSVDAPGYDSQVVPAMQADRAAGAVHTVELLLSAAA